MLHPILVTTSQLGQIAAHMTGEYVSVAVGEGQQLLFMHKSRAEELIHAIQSALQDAELEAENTRENVEEQS